MKRLRFGQLHRVTRTLIVLALLDFVVFAALTVGLGGDAADGAVRDGHYFVGNHGMLHEVARAWWELSRAVGYSLYVVWAGAIAAFAVDSFRTRDEPDRTSLLGRDNAPPRRRH